MDIPALSMSMSQVNVQQQASLSVLKMAKDMMQQNGQAICQMIDGVTAANESLIDIKL